MILIDGSALTYKTFHGNVGDIVQDGVFNHNYFRHVLINAFIWKAKNFGASMKNRLVICSDSKPYWRTAYWNSVKEEYFKDYYKTSKTKKEIDIDNHKYKGKRSKTEFDKDIWSIHAEVIELFKKYTDFVEMKVNEAEADDVIAVVSKHYAEMGEEVFIIAGDKDFKQLMTNKNIHIYPDRPFKKDGQSDWFEPIDVKMFLETMIMVGDTADNIPNIKPLLGEKTAIKYYEEPSLLENEIELNDTIIFRRDVNRKMIDFNFIPEELQTNILTELEKEIDQHNYNENEIIEYLMSHELYDLQNRRQELELSQNEILTKLNTHFNGKWVTTKIDYSQRKAENFDLDSLFDECFV